MMALIQKYYRVDANRIFLSGHSMGGAGTWLLGLEFRDKFAALAPEAGTHLSPELEAKLATGKRIPILITAGGKDTSSPAGPAVEVYRKLKEADYPAHVAVYPEDVHDAVFASSTPEVFGWFEKYSPH